MLITLLETTDLSRQEFEAIPRMNSMLTRGLTLPEYKAFLHDLYYVVWHFVPILLPLILHHRDDCPKCFLKRLYLRCGRKSLSIAGILDSRVPGRCDCDVTHHLRGAHPFANFADSAHVKVQPISCTL